MSLIEKRLTDWEIYDLLIRIDDGYLITEDEKQVLNSIMSIRWEKINKLPNSMRLLSSLSSFEISNTEISDINALSNITSLSELNLSNTKVSDISALTKLTSLLELDLSNTAVSDINALSTLTSLKILNLRSTKVSDISTLSRLIALEKLDLYGLEINKLDPLSELKALKVLNLQNSKADAIPEDLLDLDIEFRTEENVYYTMLSYKGIFIHGLTLTDQPIEIFSQKRELIRAYYRERDRVPVNECKVIFLGDAESGKTYSIRRLLNNGEYIDDFDGESTPGI